MQLALGLSVVLILIFLVFGWSVLLPMAQKEALAAPSTDPRALGLLRFHWMQDPPSYNVMEELYKEHYEDKQELPALTSLLY